MSVYLYARVSTDKQENLFPMCEGVDRHAATGSRPGLTLPRVRGGGPPPPDPQEKYENSSPCARG